MNKADAILWLVDNLKEWPTEQTASSIGIPNDWFWYRTNAMIDFNKPVIALAHDVTEITTRVFIYRADWEFARRVDQVVYIAGPMTGLPDFNREGFNAAAQSLGDKGYKSVINPGTLPLGLTQAQYMDISLAMVRCADVVHMLNGWEESEGARIEYHLAAKMGLKIEYEST